MASVLFAWELGAGLGHILQMLPLADALVRRQHCVWVALRHLDAAVADAFGGCGVRFLQAPFRSRGPPLFRRTLNFTQLLANNGFGDERELFVLACAWRNLYRSGRPDLLIFDHSPIALLASRSVHARRVVIGTGFFCPPDSHPLPPFPNRSPEEPDQLRSTDERVMARVNRLLTHWQLTPLHRLGQLYSEVDENFLTTFPERNCLASLPHLPVRSA